MIALPKSLGPVTEKCFRALKTVVRKLYVRSSSIPRQHETLIFGVFFSLVDSALSQ